MIRDVMQSAGLQGYAEIGILIFVFSFLMILALAFFGMDRQARHEALHMPLQDDELA